MGKIMAGTLILKAQEKDLRPSMFNTYLILNKN